MKRHYAAVMIFLVVVAACHSAVLHAQQKKAAQDPPEGLLDIPERFAGYRQAGEDHDVGESVRRSLQTSSILMRSYRASNGWPIEMTIVYAGATRRSLHFPEVCLVGHGWEVRKQETMPVGFDFDATRLVLVKGSTNMAVLYWYKTGDELTGDFFVNSWHWALQQLTRGVATSSMVRISAPILGDEEEAFEQLHDFAVKLTPILQERID